MKCALGWILSSNLGLSIIVAGAAAQATQPADTPPPPITAPLIAHTIATGVRGGYQVAAADLNHVGKIDLIGLGLPERRTSNVRRSLVF